MEKKAFGKYHDFVLMLTGFLLTGIIGTYVSQSYTTKSAELSAANKIFNEYSRLASDRYFTMNQVFLAIKGNKGTDVLDKRWDSYREELQKWNTARGYNRQMILLYFGQPIWNQERDIHYFFKAWGETLEASKDPKSIIDFDCLIKKSDDFLVALHTFNFSLGKSIQAGNIGTNKSSATVNKNPRVKAPCLTRQ